MRPKVRHQVIEQWLNQYQWLFFIFWSHLLLQNNYIGISKFHKRSNKVKHKEIQSPRRLTLAKMANAPMPNAYRQMITAWFNCTGDVMWYRSEEPGEGSWDQRPADPLPTGTLHRDEAQSSRCRSVLVWVLVHLFSFFSSVINNTFH